MKHTKFWISLTCQAQVMAMEDRQWLPILLPPQFLHKKFLVNDRDKIIAMLHEKDGDHHPSTSNGLCFSVIGIHGVGGSGKSTLAQFVYAHEEKDKQNNKDISILLCGFMSLRILVSATSSRNCMRQLQSLRFHALNLITRMPWKKNWRGNWMENNSFWY